MTITETHRCAQFSQVTYTSCVLFHKEIHDLINGKSFATYLINDDSSNTIHACPTISPGLLALWEWCWYDAWIFIHCTLWILDFVLFLADMVDLLPVNNWFDGRDVSYHYIVLTTNMNNTTCVTTLDSFWQHKLISHAQPHRCLLQHKNLSNIHDFYDRSTGNPS